MYQEKELLSAIENKLKNLDIDKQPALLYKPIRYTLDSGGKRMRPLLALMSCDMFGGNIDDAMQSALAIEVFHNFTLLHDDIMDNSILRRGLPTVHKKWNENIAILSGDSMMIVAYMILEKSCPKQLPLLLNVFSDTALKVCEGQQYDMEFEDRDDVSIDQYIKMITLKTSVMLAGALKLGAVAANADERSQKLIYQFGENIGIAFQLRDDLLDTYGDPKIFGKNIGGDILCDKKSFLMLSAIKQGGAAELKKACEKSGSEKIIAVTDIYNNLKIKELTEEAISDYFEKGMMSLDEINIDDDSKKTLRDYTTKLMCREK